MTKKRWIQIGIVCAVAAGAFYAVESFLECVECIIYWLALTD